jgi:hypothetical protein
LIELSDLNFHKIEKVEVEVELIATLGAFDNESYPVYSVLMERTRRQAVLKENNSSQDFFSFPVFLLGTHEGD